MTDERLRALYLAGLDARRARDARGCDVDSDTLLALARGELPPEDRSALLDRVLASATCREELALLRALVVAERGASAYADDEAAERDVLPFAPRPPRPPRRWTRVVLPLAAAAALAVVVAVPALRRADAPPVMRGADGPVALVTPAAEAAPDDARTFAWRPVAGAVRYDFELLDARGAVVAERAGPDTTVVLPADVALAGGATYRWLVRAVDEVGAPLGTSVARVRIR